MESISGICGLGTHLPQLLRNHVGGVDNIDARLSQIISELEATAKALTTLSQILEEDKRDIKDQILSSRGWKEVDVLVNRSNIAFRDVVVLIAEATGPRAPLIAVEEYVSKAMEIDSEEKELEKAKHTLEIELISAEHLLWHWRLAKFEKHSAELDQIKLRLLLVLAVVDLAKKKKITADLVDYDRDEESMLMQEVYYRNQSHKAAQRRSHRLMRRGPDPRAHQHSDPTVQEPSRAQELIHGWSQSSNSPSLKDLCAAQVLIEGWTADQFEYNDYWTEVPVNLGTLQEEVLRFQKSPDGKEGAWKAFTRLPVVCQNAITQKLQEIVKEYRWGKEYGSPVLLAVEYNTNRWPRLRNKLKGLLPFHTLSRRVPQLFIITARAPLERSKRHDRYSSSEAPIILNRHYGSRDAPVIIPRARRSQPRPDSVRHRDLISDDTDYVSEVEDGEVPPSRDDVLGAAHFLLRKWTTVFPHVNDKLRGRIWDSGTIAHKSLHRVLTQFPPRPEPVRRWSGFPPLPRNSTVETVQEDAERQNYRYSNRRRGDWKEIEVHNSRPRSKGRSSSSFYCRDDPEFAKQFHERDRPPRQKQRKYLHPEGDQYTTRRYRRQDFSGPEEEDEQYDDEDEIEVDVEVEYEDEPPRQRERGSPGPPRLTNKKSNASRDERIETNSSFHREPRDRTGTDMSQRWSDQDTLNSRHARA